MVIRIEPPPMTVEIAELQRLERNLHQTVCKQMQIN